MRSVTFALAVSALALTAGCNRKAEKAEAPPPVTAPAPAPAPAPETPIEVSPGFAHQAQFDASGYYLPDRTIQTGVWKLSHVAVGAPSDFSGWEAGSRDAVFGPILFQFEDTSSPKQTTEGGAETHTVTLRVLPQAYRFEQGKVTFRGSDPKVGEILFSGAFDTAALTQARNEGFSPKPVLRGTLKVGSAPARQVALNYYLGD